MLSMLRKSGGADANPILSPQILVAIVALDRSNNCHPICDVRDAAGPLAGWAHSMELFRLRRERGGGAASGDRHRNPVFSRVYVRLFAGRAPGRERAAH